VDFSAFKVAALSVGAGGRVIKPGFQPAADTTDRMNCSNKAEDNCVSACTQVIVILRVAMLRPIMVL